MKRWSNMHRIDCGRYTFDLRIMSGNICEITEAAEEFAMPPYAVNIFPTGGGAVSPVIHLSGEVQLAALRPEGGGVFTARIYNPDSAAHDYTLTVGNASGSFTAGAHEIMTLRAEDGTLSLCDMIETEENK